MLHHTVRTLDLTKETQASPLATRRRARQWRERNDGVEARRKPRQTRGPPADAAQRSHDRLGGTPGLDDWAAYIAKTKSRKLILADRV